MRKAIITGIGVLLLIWVSAVNYGQVTTTPAPGGPITDSQADTSPNNVEETLIDFTSFEDLIQKSGLYDEDTVRSKNLSDLTTADIDSKSLAPTYRIQASDLNYDRWQVQLNSSANTYGNRRWSYAKKVNLKSGKEFKGPETESGKPLRGTGNTVLGVRIHFPDYDHNAYAKIAPPYEVRAYDKDGQVVSRKDTGKFIGVIDNVGQIKKISLDVSGRNFKNGVAIRLRDQFDEVQEYFMGYTYFANWRRLSWENPNYVTSVDHRDLFRVPLYPREVPFKKFDSIIVYRPGQETGGDFVIYFRKIDMWFDFAVPPESLADLDIDDEDSWKILTKRARERKRLEELKARERIELMRQENRKIGKNSETKDVTETLKKEDAASPAVTPQPPK